MLTEKLLLYHLFPVTIKNLELIQEESGAFLKIEASGLFSFLHRMMDKKYEKRRSQVFAEKKSLRGMYVNYLRIPVYRYYIGHDFRKFSYLRAVKNSLLLSLSLHRSKSRFGTMLRPRHHQFWELYFEKEFLLKDTLGNCEYADVRIPHRFFFVRLWRRIFPRACVYGIFVKNPKTDIVARYFFEGECFYTELYPLKRMLAVGRNFCMNSVWVYVVGSELVGNIYNVQCSRNWFNKE